MRSQHLPSREQVLLRWMNWEERLLSVAQDCRNAVAAPGPDEVLAYADHLLPLFPRADLDELRGLVRQVITQASGLFGALEALLESSGLSAPGGLSMAGERPRVSPTVWAFWRDHAQWLSLDSLICFVAARQDAWASMAQHARWSDLPGVRDHGLEAVFRQEGLADLHVHLSGSHSKHRAWLEHLWGRLPRDLALGADFVARRQLGQDARVTLMRRRDAEGRVSKVALWDAAYQAWVGLKRSFLVSAQGEASYLPKAARDLIAKVSDLPHEERGPPGDNPPFAEVAWLFRFERSVLAWGLQQLRRLPRDAMLAGQLDVYLGGRQQYLRENLLYPGNSPGLTRFRTYFDRSNAHVRWRGRTPVAVIRSHFHGPLLHLAENTALRYLELRISPLHQVTDYQRFFKTWLDLAKTLKRGEVRDLHGCTRFVIHFLRQPSLMSAERGQRERARAALERQAAVLHLFRVRHPVLASQIVGLDVANLERHVPPAAFASVLTWLRPNPTGDLSASAFSGRYLTSLVGREDVPKLDAGLPDLGLTYHAGEDALHPLDGMRQMDDAMQMLAMRSGDRMGHGLSVGWPRGQAALLPASALSAPEMLLTLAWLSQSVEGILVPNDERQALDDARDTLLGLGIDSPGRNWTDWNALRRNASKQLDWLDRHPRSSFPLPGNLNRVFASLPSLASQAQTNLMAKLESQGIFLEMCPSSNRCVLGLDSLEDHPAMELHALGRDTGVTLNTDNPGTFHTRMDVECALMLEALVRKGVAPAQALERLKYWITNGMRAGFASQEIGVHGGPY